MATPRNIPLRVFRKYLEYKCLKHTRTNGGHEVWIRKDLLRPVIIQTHKDPIPLFIVKNNLRTIGETIDDLMNFINSN